MVCYWLQTQGYCKLDHAALKHLLDTGGQVNIPPAMKQHEERGKHCFTQAEQHEHMSESNLG